MRENVLDGCFAVKTRKRNQKPRTQRYVLRGDLPTKTAAAAQAFMHGAHRAQVCPMTLIILLRCAKHRHSRGTKQSGRQENVLVLTCVKVGL